MNLSFYVVSSKYCDYLRLTDPCVPYTMDQKTNRPFIGIVLEVNGFHYYAPLTSPKPKHQKMKNQLDFYKINGGLWGAINFNNMIPVPMNCLKKVDLKITNTDTDTDINYKRLLANQLSWCNAHKTALIKQAENLYRAITNGTAHEELARRCCCFTMDEKLLITYTKEVLINSIKPKSSRKI